jgi:hypothetical protein
MAPLVEQSVEAPSTMTQDERNPFDVDCFLDSFTEERQEIPVAPDSPLGQAMTRARESWGPTGLPDPAEFVFPAPIPVDVEDE